MAKFHNNVTKAPAACTTAAELHIKAPIAMALRSGKLNLYNKDEGVLFEAGLHEDVDGQDIAIAAVHMLNAHCKNLKAGHNCFAIWKSQKNARTLWVYGEHHNGKQLIIITNPPR